MCYRIEMVTPRTKVGRGLPRKEFLDVGADSCRHRLSDGSPDTVACSSYSITNPLDGAVEQASVSLPPIIFDCDQALKWRNNNRCAVDSSAASLQKPTMGTEMDWMTFLYAVNRQVGFNEVMALHRAACRRTGDINRPCSIPTGVDANGNPDAGDPMSWTDVELPEVNSIGQVSTRWHGGFLSGAQRKYPAGDLRIDAIQAAGLEHGVDQNTAP
jgi:hypothetical protein